MILCMFTPRELALERGWPGRIDGDRVVQLAAQTLQAYFTGGGVAREHAEYALDDVQLRAPVLHPPSVRVFAGDDFTFANPAAIHGPDDVVQLPQGVDEIVPVLRLAAIVGADGTIGGHTLMNHWHAPGLSGQKSRDFAISLGPVVLAPPQESLDYDDWEKLLVHAARNTKLMPGDVIAAGAEPLEPVGAGDEVELELPPFGALRNYVAAAS
jgi:hypothetical protein